MHKRLRRIEPFESNVLVHVGYPRCGSTWLQDTVFQTEFGFFPVSRRNESIREFVLLNELVFDVSAVASRLLQRTTHEDGNLQPVLSLERLAGSPHSGGFDSALLADRVHRIFPNAKVLIVIREQRAMILSSYKQYISAGGAISLKQYLNPPALANARTPSFDLAYFDFHLLVRKYQELFGKEQVLVLPLELLQVNAHRFVSAVLNHLGLDHTSVKRFPGALNQAPTAGRVFARRYVNRWFVRSRLNPTAPLHVGWIAPGSSRQRRSGFDNPLRKRLDQRWRLMIEETVGDRYRESNTLTAETTGLDLGPMGYD